MRISLTLGCSGVYRIWRIVNYLEYQNPIFYLNDTNLTFTLGPKRNRNCERIEDGCQRRAHMQYCTVAIAHARCNASTSSCKVDIKTDKKEN
jgi:hypothetical protein